MRPVALMVTAKVIISKNCLMVASLSAIWYFYLPEMLSGSVELTLNRKGQLYEMLQVPGRDS